MAKKVTIYDIAKKLNVTPATVSYALNNVPKISKEMKKKVLDTARSMGYIRDNTAVSLSTGKTHLIALFLPFNDISSAFLQNPFYGEFIGFFEMKIKKAGYDLLIQPQYDKKELDRWLIGRGVDAAVVIGTFPKHYSKSFKRLDLPVVLVDVFSDNSEGYVNIRLDDLEGEYSATKYLIDNGHRNIAFVGGDIKNSIVDKRRFEGYKKALEDSNIPFNQSYVFKSETTFDGGERVSKELIKIKGLTGAICAADTMAIGIMTGYRKANKLIPNDLSIIGFDDIQSSALLSPGLTTVKQNIKEKATLSADYLLDIIENNDNNPKEIVLKTELISRETVRKI